MKIRTFSLLIFVSLLCLPAWAQEDESPSRLPDYPIPLLDESLIEPHPPLIQIGPGLVSTGRLERGFDVPGGRSGGPRFGFMETCVQGSTLLTPAAVAIASSSGHKGWISLEICS